MYKTICLCVLFCLLALVSSSAQLIGNRGVVTLPRDWIYHDNFTLAASRGAARFAILEEHKENEKKVLVQQRRLRGGQVKQGGSQEAEPAYRQSPNKVGREFRAQEVLAYGDSLYFNPPEENRSNVKIPEIEAERRTAKAKAADRFEAAQPRRGRQRGLRAQLPQFASKPLVPENINHFRSRFVAAEDRSELRAKINIRNAALASGSSSSTPAQPLAFTSTSHMARLPPQPPQPAGKPRFSFNFRVQH